MNLPPSIDLFIQYLHNETEKTFHDFYSDVNKLEIRYPLLWFLFQLNGLALTRCQITGAPLCFKVESAREKDSKTFEIKGYHWELGGEQQTLSIFIDRFEGRISLQSLEVLPLGRIQIPDSVKAELFIRAEKCKMLSLPHCYFNGTAYQKNGEEITPITTRGQITIDPHYFERMNLSPDDASLEPTKRPTHDSAPKHPEEDSICVSPLTRAFCHALRAWGKYAKEAHSKKTNCLQYTFL